MELRTVPPLAIFAATYLVVAAGKLPSLRLDRAGAAFVGAVAMVLAGGLGGRQALAAVDFSTLALLLGMMIVVANLRISGAFTAAAGAVLRRANSGFGLLAITIAAAGVLAAFFINDVVCLALAPLLIETARLLDAPPEPFLLGLATASNIGSAATITGNPQNMIVAGYAHLRYAPFALKLAPIAAAGLAIDFAIIALLYRRPLRQVRRKPGTGRLRRRRFPVRFMIKSVIIAGGVLIGFVAGFPTGMVALTAGAISLLTRSIRPERVYALIDWTMLLMFAGLFIVVAGAETTGFQNEIVSRVGASRLMNPLVLAGVLTALSNLVSNVPAVMLFRPLYHSLGYGRDSALVIASASTFAGNLTVLGSIANLIVLEEARRQRIVIGFYEYMRIGVPVTLLTLALDVAMLSAGV
jgi:Na+/H+ antiporter NhaD/arsenite permease-like protein